MRKIILNVPSGTGYISEWVDFTYPTGKIIVDKQICGCGFTEYCLRNNLPIILCSPRKVLLENKAEQHLGNVYYFRNERDIDSDVESWGDSLKKTEIELLESIDVSRKQNYLKKLKSSLQEWVRNFQGVPKILVTYDSLKHVLDALGSKADKFYVVVDEFQSIFTDSHFKAEVESSFLNSLGPLKNVMYLSATPMLDNYLIQLPEFANLDYLELHWPEEMVQTVSITRRRSYSLSKDVSKIIQDYRTGNFPKKVYQDGTIKVSNEIVFYMNSVKDVIGVIKSSGLRPDEVNIICAENKTNTKRMKAQKLSYGKIPLKGEPHKMFTFCTKTTFLGADFYSTCASTVICSDCKVSSLSLDVVLDLPQIIGRQRLPENVFKNECLFLYKVQSKDEDWRFKEWSEFNEVIEKKREVTDSLLIDWDKLSVSSRQGFLDILKQAMSRSIEKFEKNFLGLTEGGHGIAYNKLAELSEIRAFEVTRDQYLNSFVVKKTLEDEGFIVDPDLETTTSLFPDLNLEYISFIETFGSLGAFDQKMQCYCMFLLKHQDKLPSADIGVPQEYLNYVNLLGIQKICSLKYRKKSLEEEYMFISLRDKIAEILISNLTRGSRYLRTDMKALFVEIYKNLGIPRIGKATDISLFCDVKEVLIPTPEGTKRGFEIL